MSDQEEYDHHFFTVLGEAVEAARIGRLVVRLRLEDGTEYAAVPEESPLSEGGNVTEVDDSGMRADVVLGDSVVMVARVRSFTVERPEAGGSR